MTNELSPLPVLIAQYNEDNAKFEEKGNASAGTRARATLMEIKKFCDKRRKEIQAKKNAA